MGPELLKALTLGAAGLYLTQALGLSQALGHGGLQRAARQWLRRLRPAHTGWLAAAASRHSQVLSVFVVQSGGQRPRLVAAQILDDAIEILAEQPLVLQAPAGTVWDQLDLQRAFDRLRQALAEQDRDDQPLLLIDPLLQGHLDALQGFGRERALLRHPDLEAALRALNGEEQELLRQWLNRPSHTSLLESPGCLQVMQQLSTLQQHWGHHMPQDMANVAGVLELSIALGNHQPQYALL